MLRFGRLGLLAASLAFPWVPLSAAATAALEEIKIGSTGPGISILPLEIASRKEFFAPKDWMS